MIILLGDYNAEVGSKNTGNKWNISTTGLC
jgi:hypothetical protein